VNVALFVRHSLAAWALLAASASAHDFDDVRRIGAELVSWSRTQDARGGRPIDIAALFALVEIGDRRGGLSLSPDGRHAAFLARTEDLTNDDYRYELILIDLDDPSSARAVARAGGYIYDTRAGRRSGGSIERRPLWSPDGESIAFIAEVEGRAEIWRYDLASDSARTAAALDGDARRFAWSRNVLVVQTLRARAELVERERQARTSGFLATETYEPGYSQDILIDDTNGPTVAIDGGGVRPATADEASRLNVTEARARISPRSDNGDVALPALELTLEMAGGQRVACASPLCNGVLDEAWAGADSSIVLFRRTEDAGAITAIYLWNAETGEVTLVRRGEERLESCALDADRDLICFRESAATPRQLVRLDTHGRGAGELHVLFDPNAYWLSRATPRIDRLTVRDSDGNTSFAHLIYPLNWRPGRRHPLVLVQYRSRGFLFGGTGRDAPIFPLSARGYFVLSIDRPEAEALSRLHPVAEVQRQTEFDGTENAIKVAAIEALIDACVARRLCDRHRVAATGMSDGAETVYALLDRDVQLRAAIVSTPPLDPFAWALMSGTFRSSQVTRFGMRSPWDETDNPWAHRWRRESSFYHAGHYRTPLMLHLAESEVLFAMPLITRLRDVGAPVEFYVYPDTYHNRARPLQLQRTQERTLDWIEYWLSDREPAASDDPGATVRWALMRHHTD
jgi:dipeptidyl aminopeptidase/acylaminoacyl peptidase